MVVLGSAYPSSNSFASLATVPCQASHRGSLQRTAAPTSSHSRIGMEQSSKRFRTTVARDRACASERILAFLHARYPVKMAENVAADIGVTAAAIRKLEERGSAPSLAVFGRMVNAYGPDFLAAVFGWAWLDQQHRDARRIELEAGIARQQAELAQLAEARA